MKIFKFTLLFCILSGLLAFSVFAQKMKAEDVTARHLDSIATAEKRNSLKSLMIVGDTSVKFISQKNLLVEGRVVLASAGEKNFFGMNLNAVDYPMEKFSFDGKKSKVAHIINNERSPLGNFIISNNLLIEESLLGGILSTSWALHNISAKKAKLSYDGTKKINGKETYVLNYSRKGGSDVTVSLYFDKETFRHVRTEYKRTASASLGRTIDESARQNETRLKLTEDFSDFKEINGVTLPQKLSIFYSVTGQRGTTEIEWSFNLTEYAFNQTLSDSTFDIDTPASN